MQLIQKILILFLLIVFTPAFTLGQHLPQLIVYISIDQMQPDYFDRYAKDYTGAFKRLMNEGIVFANADLNYASSETGPGHATLATGTYPNKSGIFENEWIDRQTGKTIYCVEDSSAKAVEGEGGGFSPRNLMATAIGDWLKDASPHSKVISLSVKDRAAILMGGLHPDEVFWYDRQTGYLVTSSYYSNRIPNYLKTFNDSDWIGHHVPAAWTKMRPEEAYLQDGPDELEGEFQWEEGSSVFPHRFLPEKKREQIIRSPYGDLLILDFAKNILKEEQLGLRNATDLFCLSLSCTDYIGHAFGPNSHEMHDHLLRLDRALGDFLNDIEQQLGSSNVLVVVSADHAVQTLPEYRTTVGKKAARRIMLDRDIEPKVGELNRTLQYKFNVHESLVRFNGFLNYAAAAKAGIDSITLEQNFRERLLQINGIADVFFRRELLDPRTTGRPYLKKFRRSYYPPRGEDFQILGAEHSLFTTQPTGTTHGTPYDYDTHVPIIAWGSNLKNSLVRREVHTVDIAPTLAKILGIPFPLYVDGTTLQELLR